MQGYYQNFRFLPDCRNHQVFDFTFQTRFFFTKKIVFLLLTESKYCSFKRFRFINQYLLHSTVHIITIFFS